MLRFNTFRATRYLRSKFVEGKYLLASEASDIELELIDLLRTMTKNAIGDVAIENAWKVSRLSTTQLLIAPGEAWLKGLPFIFRYGKDELVSGATLSLGTVPVGVTATDDSSGNGKVITFNNAATTPSNTYRLVITASEELITDVQDPFLKNVNITEDTGQKIRLHFRLNIVPDALQSESPIPYTDENSTAGSPTNFPSAGGFASPNYSNRVTVTPVAAGNGELIATNIISGSEGIDGRSVELTVRNNPGLGGGNPLPNGSTAQQAFSNGFLIDSNGSVFYVNAIFNDVVNTQLIIRIDQEYTQPIPEIINTRPYILIKRDVYVTDDVNGTPQGQMHWPIAKVVWDSSNHFVHDSVVTDLRNSINEEDFYQKLVNDRFTLNTISAANFSLAIDGGTLSWDAAVELIGPSFSTQTIAAGSGYLVDGGFLVYEMDLDTPSSILKGSLSVTSTTTGTSISLSGSPSLASVSKGNIFVIGSQSAEIIAIDDVNKTLTLATSVSSSGSATIYLDSYASASYITGANTYVLASRVGSVVLVADIMTLAPGQSGKLGVPAPSGVVKARLYDAVDTTLPTGTSATIDGVSVANGDLVLFSNLASGNNEVYKVSGVGTSLVWSPIGIFGGNTTPTAGDLIIFSAGTQFANQLAEFNGTTFQINNPVRYFNGTDFWELSSIQNSSLSDNSSGTIFSVDYTGSENILVDYSLSRGGLKEVGTLWITNDHTSAYVGLGGTSSGTLGVSFTAAISGSNVQLNYTTTSTGSSASMKYTVKRWSDTGGGPTGLPSYSPGIPGTISNAAFVMSDNSGTPLNCNPTFNILSKTNVTLTFSYVVNRNAGTTVGDLDVYVNGQRTPRFVSGVTLDGYYTEVSATQIQFSSNLQSTALSIEIIKRV